MTCSAPSITALAIANWPTGPGAEDGDRLAALDVAELGAHVARREDVRQEQDLLVGEVVLDLDRADVGERARARTRPARRRSRR
jgi:hypothetical protein